MSILTRNAVIALNPATGAVLAELPATAPEDVAGFVARSARAQAAWAETPWRTRRQALDRWRAILSRDADQWANLIRDEIGKPAGEALGEVVTTLDFLRWTARHGAHALAEGRLPRGWQRLLLIPPARLGWRPMGVIGLIGTWNYPLFLTATVIADALAAGNGVVWKPSELASLVGTRLQQSLDEAGFPPGLVAAVVGGSEVGQALVAAPIAKAHFTGGVAAGRRVLAAMAGRGRPATVELSGYDPAVILPDAPFESTVRGLTWAAYVGAGQTCAAVKRVYVVGDPAPWAEALADRARALRVGDPASAEVDMGPLISISARDRFDGFVQAAIQAGAIRLTGAKAIDGPGAFYQPTVLLADPGQTAPEAELAGCFGPVLLVRGVPDVETAIRAANASDFGLTASVWSRDRRQARLIATRLETGLVAINDAVAPLGHAAAPFGGTKASGFGRSHGLLGIREFAEPQVLHDRRPGGWRPQVFPYRTALMQRGLSLYRRLFHPPAGRG